ncbi:MAG TPA: radical SAM protein [Kofleriaceae bacterium]|nr:radical SAM protein [Kofleriaceae bacterium]
MIVASVTPPSYDIHFVDENVEPIDFDEPADLVALTCMTAQADRVFEIAAAFRARGVTVVVGGLLATRAPEILQPHVDAVCRGEAEAVWPQLLADFERGALKPCYGRPSSAIGEQFGHKLQKAPPQTDLTQVVRPRFDLAQKDFYPSVWIETSRGCQHRCNFCAASISYRDKLGYKTNDQIVAEIKFVQERWNNPYIMFADDNFAANRIRTKSLLEKLAPLGIKWSGQTDISYADDPELLQLMHKSGCMIMLSGFESISEEGLQDMDLRNWKKKRLATYADSIARVQDHGVGVYGSFTLGLDSDTKDIFDQTSAFARTNMLAGIQVSCVTPFPGTPVYEKMKAENRLLPDKSWAYYSVFDAVFEPKHMTPEELDAGCLKVYSEFYSREFALKKTRHFKQIYGRLIKEKYARDDRRDALTASGRTMV